MGLCFSRCFTQIVPQLARFVNFELDLRRVSERFARVELLPAETAIRVTKRIVWFRIVVVRRMFGGSSGFAGQLRRQGFGVFGGHWPLRIDGVKDKQPLVFDLDLVPAECPSMRKLERIIISDLPPWQNVNQKRLLALPVFQDNTSKDVSLKILHLNYFSNGKL